MLTLLTDRFCKVQAEFPCYDLGSVPSKVVSFKKLGGAVMPE